jgi:undecaprenyl-diphosphatase
MVLNAQAGTAVVHADPRPVFAERLPEAVVHELEEGEDLADAVESRMSGDDAPTVLGVYGGDGSVSRMAALARRYDLPLLAMPGGTFNHFVRSIGLEDVESAIDALEAGEGQTVTVLEASADGEDPITVLNALSIGTYPAFLHKREGHEPLGKWLGGLVAAGRELREVMPLTIVRDGRRSSVWSVFIGVGRNNPDLVATMQRGKPDDGMLDVRIHHARGSRSRAITALAFGPRTAAGLRALRLMPPDTDLERFVLRSFEVAVRQRPGRPSVFVHDGELEQRDPAGFTLACTAVPAALRVYAPAGSESGGPASDVDGVSRAGESPGSGRRGTDPASET